MTRCGPVALVGLVLLVAMGAAAAEGLPAFLKPGAVKKLVKRTRKIAPGGATVEGAAVLITGVKENLPAELTVIDEDAVAVRVLLEVPGATLAVLVAVDKLERVAKRGTIVVPAADAGLVFRPGAAGARLRAGAPVTVGSAIAAPDRRLGPRVELAFRSKEVEIEGYTSPAYVGVTWTPEPDFPRAKAANAVVSAGTPLVDSRGRPFAKLLEKSPRVYRDPTTRADGLTVVTLSTDHALVRGLVPRSALDEAPQGFGDGGDLGSFVGHGGGGLGSTGDQVILPAGTRLHGSPDGPVVGVTRVKSAWPLMKKVRGAPQIVVRTPIGTLLVHAVP